MLLKDFCYLLFIGFASAQLNMKSCGINRYRKSRIIGGKQAEAAKHPWMVFLELDVGPNIVAHCGGAIINKNLIVSAAHCFNGSRIKTSKAYVGLQFKNVRDRKYVQKLEISEIVIHPEYKNSAVYDIVLVKTAEPINIDSSEGRLNGICLPESKSPYPTGEATIVGWGCTNFKTKAGTNDLNEAVIPILPEDRCTKVYGQRYHGMICAGGDGKSTCYGDSGGPLIQIDAKGVAYLIGINSRASSENRPALFTKVSAVLDWMNNEMT